MTHYSQGVIRKSKREKDREAAEAKKRDEEEQAAQASTPRAMTWYEGIDG
jgi:U2-associated protein SR140